MQAQAWVTLIVGLVATVGVRATRGRRTPPTADRQWWRRTTWAFERSLSDNNVEARLGWQMLEALLGSRPVTSSDISIMRVIAAHVALRENNVDEGQHHGGEDDTDV